VREPDEPSRTADLPADVEHDLVNSLASIVGFSQVIRRDPSLPEDLRQSAALLVEEATRTQRMVQTLLDLVRQRPSEPDSASNVPTDYGPAPASGTTTSDTRPSVLVLEDEPSFRVFLAKALALLGYEAVMTSQGPEAVERATNGDDAVILCDHQMPGMSGIEVYEAVVALRPDVATRFVMMSGDVLDPALTTFAATHPLKLLAKPFDLDTLDRTLRTVLEATGQSRG
jgi:CheY-like chemotaxis protein